MKLSVKAAGLACGIFWGACLGLWTLLTALTPLTLGKKWLELMVGTYPWYEISVKGAGVGLVMGFIDGFVGAALLVLLYNLFAKQR